MTEDRGRKDSKERKHSIHNTQYSGRRAEGRGRMAEGGWQRAERRRGVSGFVPDLWIWGKVSMSKFQGSSLKFSDDRGRTTDDG
jgi:hypothetical protein